MADSYLEAASNPLQYDGEEIKWHEEGSGLHFTRRMLLEAINPHLGPLDGRHVLDVGCGQGWLVDVLSERGAVVMGIDPSARNIARARDLHPGLDLELESLESLTADRTFDLITAVMSFEHIRDLDEAFSKLHTLVAETGRLVVAAGDIERFKTPRFDYEIDAQVVSEGEIAIRTDYKDRMGVLYDILRTPDYFMERARANGFRVADHRPFAVPSWVYDEEPQYAELGGKPIFQIYQFTPEQ